MCLIFFAHQVLPDCPLILAANRDEFHARPTAPADIWRDYPHIIAGRDLEQGGTWLGISLRNKWAALTNYRDPQRNAQDKQSRGLLLKDYLTTEISAQDFITAIQTAAGETYNGFNLLLGQADSVYYYNNITNEYRQLEPGVYGLSNALLNTDWPKVTDGKQSFQEIMHSSQSTQPEAYFDLLQNRTRAEDERLPATGIPIEYERLLSSRFICSPAYGTRASTVIFKNAKNEFTFLEKTFDPDGNMQYDARFDVAAA